MKEKLFYMIIVFFIPMALNAIIVDTTTVFPEYHDIEYFLDLFTARYPWYLTDNVVWKDNYFMINGGCFDIQYIFTEEQARFRVPLNNWLAWGMKWDAYYSMEYRLNDRFFYLEFAPYNKFVPILILNPIFQKNQSDMGAGMRFRNDFLRFRIGMTIDNFDNNYSFKYRSDPFYPYYATQPIVFRTDGRVFNKKTNDYLKWDIHISNPYSMDFFTRRTYLYSSDSFVLSLKSEGMYHYKNTVFYSEFEWNKEIFSVYQDTVETDTFVVIPQDFSHDRKRFLLQTYYDIDDRKTISAGIELYDIFFEDTIKSINTQRYFYMPMVGGKIFVTENLFTEGIFAWFRGTREYNSLPPMDSIDYSETRFILTVQYNFTNGGKLLLRKGFELDKDDIENGGKFFFYDKGYVMFSVPLDFIYKEDNE